MKFIFSKDKAISYLGMQETLNLSSFCYEQEGKYLSQLHCGEIPIVGVLNATLQGSLEDLEVVCSTNESLLSSPASCPLTVEEVAKMRVFHDSKILVQSVIKDLPTIVAKSEPMDYHDYLVSAGVVHA